MVLAAPSSDACIALTAVETLRQAVEDCYFVSEDFTPFLAPFLSHLPALMSTCDQLDSQVRPMHLCAVFEFIRCSRGLWHPPLTHALR
jgi:hypothetical protein